MTRTRRLALPVVVTLLAVAGLVVTVNLARIRPASSSALLPLSVALPGVTEPSRQRGTQ